VPYPTLFRSRPIGRPPWRGTRQRPRRRPAPQHRDHAGGRRPECCRGAAGGGGTGADPDRLPALRGSSGRLRAHPAVRSARAGARRRRVRARWRGESSEPDPEVTHIEAPTAPCEFLPQESTSPQSPGTRSSGDMSFTIPEGWSTDIDWGGTLPHATDVASAEKHIEQNYYSVAQIGQVDWSGADGEYPGAEDAAAAYVQCHLTRAD